MGMASSAASDKAAAAAQACCNKLVKEGKLAVVKVGPLAFLGGP